MLKRFFDWNVRLCDAIERCLPKEFTRSLHCLHADAAAALMNARPGLTVLDVGGGRHSLFAEQRRMELGHLLVGLDIAHEELRHNQRIDAGLVADACRRLPFADACADLLVTRSVLEHLYNNEEFLREAYRVLKPGGSMAHVFPCRYAPFALVNRLLPNAVAQRLLYYFFPQWRDSCGFKVYYRNCYDPRMPNLMRQLGFEITQYRVRYYQSIYFKFFVPLYLVSLSYDVFTWSLRMKPLACQMFVVARKK